MTSNNLGSRSGVVTCSKKKNLPSAPEEKISAIFQRPNGKRFPAVGIRVSDVLELISKFLCAFAIESDISVCVVPVWLKDFRFIDSTKGSMSTGQMDALLKLEAVYVEHHTIHGGYNAAKVICLYLFA